MSRLFDEKEFLLNATLYIQSQDDKDKIFDAIDTAIRNHSNKLQTRLGKEAELAVKYAKESMALQAKLDRAVADNERMKGYSFAHICECGKKHKYNMDDFRNGG